MSQSVAPVMSAPRPTSGGQPLAPVNGNVEGPVLGAAVVVVVGAAAVVTVGGTVVLLVAVVAVVPSVTTVVDDGTVVVDVELVVVEVVVVDVVVVDVVVVEVVVVVGGTVVVVVVDVVVVVGGTVVVVVDVVVVACGATVKLCCTGGAALCVASPAWSASTVQVPDPTSVMVAPSTVQTSGVVVENVTGRPDEAVACAVTGGSPRVASPSGSNVMV